MPDHPEQEADASSIKKDDFQDVDSITHHLEHIEGDEPDSIENTRPSKAVWLITFAVSMGGFLFGTFI